MRSAAKLPVTLTKTLTRFTPQLNLALSTYTNNSRSVAVRVAVGEHVVYECPLAVI